ncbi:hypothetical protein BJ742DRAFT_774096 [Cladochytrium replicatum]|nr:hypothetical protein BJ742DRAFT_774096 [Cladochytrium replicatum]
MSGNSAAQVGESIPLTSLPSSHITATNPHSTEEPSESQNSQSSPALPTEDQPIENTRGDVPTPEDDTLPTYANVLDENKLPDYDKIDASRRKRIFVRVLIGVIILAVVIALNVVLSKLFSSDPKTESNERRLRASSGVSLGEATIGTDLGRHLVTYDDFSICVVESWKGSPHLVMNGSGTMWYNSLDKNTNVSQIAPYNVETLVALSSFNTTINLIQLRFAKVSTPFQANAVASLPLSNITSPDFRYPIVDASIHLSRLTQETMFVAMADSAMSTWIYRLSLPEFTVESSASINSSSGSYLRFAQSYGYADLHSNSTENAILMLSSAAATTLEQSFAMLIPGNLSVVYHPGTVPAAGRADDTEEYAAFLGPASRGAISPTGDYLTVMGDRAKIAADISTKNSTNYHRFVINLQNWDTYKFRVNESLMDVGTSSPGFATRVTVEGYEKRIDISSLPTSSKPSVLASTAGEKVESIVSNIYGIFVLEYNGSWVSLRGLSFY